MQKIAKSLGFSAPPKVNLGILLVLCSGYANFFLKLWACVAQRSKSKATSKEKIGNSVPIIRMDTRKLAITANSQNKWEVFLRIMCIVYCFIYAVLPVGA